MLTPATHSSVATPFERLNRVTLTALLKAQLTSAQIHPAAVLWVLGLFGGCEPAISPFVNYIKDVYPPAPIVDLDMVKAIQKKLKYPDGKDDSKIKKLRLQLGQDLALALCDGADTSLYRIVVAVLRKHEDGEVRELTRDMLGALPGVKSKLTPNELWELLQLRPDLFLLRSVDYGDWVCRLLIRWWEFSPSWWSMS